MKSNAERAREQLTLTPDVAFSLQEDGFLGALYRPRQDEYPGKAVIQFGGSDGIYPLTQMAAEVFVQRGITVLALAYWNEPGLPDAFERVPVEPVEKAALWLLEHGYKQVGLWGISMGAELALLAGSLMPGLISSVAAVCPTQISTQGFVKKKGIQQLECSAFSWRGKDIPWARLQFSKAAVLRDCLKEKSMCLRSCYLDAVQNAQEEAQIPVERICGPILLLYPQHDAMWPSEIAAEKIVQRLKAHGFAYPVKQVGYQYASHMLIPIKTRSKAMFQVERKHPEECRKSDLDSLEQALAFWREVW